MFIGLNDTIEKNYHRGLIFKLETIAGTTQKKFAKSLKIANLIRARFSAKTKIN